MLLDDARKQHKSVSSLLDALTYWKKVHDDQYVVRPYVVQGHVRTRHRRQKPKFRLHAITGGRARG